MATLATNGSKTRPWRARRKRFSQDILIGYYATREEAEQAEREFDEQSINGVGWAKGLRWDRFRREWYDPATDIPYPYCRTG